MSTERRYHLWAINDKKGREIRLSGYPMSHAKCMNFKSRFTPRDDLRMEVREVTA